MTEAVSPDEGGEGAAYADPATLPEPVRARVVGLAADVLPQVAALPPALRRVAAFAPARRARLGGRAIADALADDDDFRGRVAVQVAARPGRDHDPVELAARSWLARDDGWQDAIVRAGEFTGPRHDREEAERERMRARIAEAEQAVKDARTKARGQVEELKSDNTTLRRKLGEVRTAERQARETAEEALRLAEETRGRAAGLEAGQDKELRRLRARVEQLEAELAAQRQSERRTARADRDEATIRARLLLDAVIDAAAGLRRELALPAVVGAPADRVEGRLAEGDERPIAPQGPRTASALEQMLALPRSRLVIDGYNVSKWAWPQSPLETQRQRLLRGVAPVVARTGTEATVVFDAARLTNRPVVAAPRGVKVLFSPPDVIADDVIRELVAAEPPGRMVLVVTDDQALARDARASGVRTVSAATLVDLLGG